MNEELYRLIEALRREAKGAKYIQLRSKDYSLTSPMSIEDAANYIYYGKAPLTKTMPSELITEQLDRLWAANEALRQTDLARTRANEYNTRTFYRDVALPTLTLGLSKYVPGLEGAAYLDMTGLASLQAAMKNPALNRMIWPAAATAASLLWLANARDVPTMPRTYNFDAIEDREDTPLTVTVSPTPATKPVSESETPVEGNLSGNNPEPENSEDPNKNKKKKSKFREESEKVAKNIGKGYGKALKALIYGSSIALPIAVATYGAYKLSLPDPTEADTLLNVSKKELEEMKKLWQAERIYEQTDSMRKLLQLRRAIKTAADVPSGLPSGFKPIVGYNEQDPNLVVTYSSSGQPDSIVTLQKEPDTSRFKHNGTN